MWFGLTWDEMRKSAWIGLYLALQGMALQLLKSQLFLHQRPPAVQFIVTVFILYVLTGFLFAAVYFILRDYIPGRTRARKGFNYSLLVFGSVAFGGLIGTIGLDLNGGSDLLTAAKIDDYAIAITDFVNFSLAGIVLGLIAEPKLVRPFRPALDAKRLWQLSAAGFVLFPIATALLFKGLSSVIPMGIEVPTGAEGWFYLGTFVPLAVSGASIPLFYGIVRGDSLAGPRARPLHSPSFSYSASRPSLSSSACPSVSRCRPSSTCSSPRPSPFSCSPGFRPMPCRGAGRRPQGGPGLNCGAALLMGRHSS